MISSLIINCSEVKNSEKSLTQRFIGNEVTFAEMKDANGNNNELGSMFAFMEMMSLNKDNFLDKLTLFYINVRIRLIDYFNKVYNVFEKKLYKSIDSSCILPLLISTFIWYIILSITFTRIIVRCCAFVLVWIIFISTSVISFGLFSGNMYKVFAYIALGIFAIICAPFHLLLSSILFTVFVFYGQLLDKKMSLYSALTFLIFVFGFYFIFGLILRAFESDELSDLESIEEVEIIDGSVDVSEKKKLNDRTLLTLAFLMLLDEEYSDNAI